MDPDQSFEAYKDRIGMRLARKLLTAFEENKISEDLLSEISTYILDNIDKAKTNADLLDFLEHLAGKWALFQDILVAEEAQVQEEETKESVEKIEELLDQNKIDEAMKTAEVANQEANGGVN
jgi:hypothetical protein